MTKTCVGSCCRCFRRTSNCFDFMARRLEPQLSVNSQHSVFSQFARMIAVCRRECVSNATPKVLRELLCSSVVQDSRFPIFQKHNVDASEARRSG
jgi:hypothetical protein